MVRYISLLLFIGVAFWSCEDESDKQEDSSSLSTSMTLDTLFVGSSVYMSGWYLDTTLTQMVACYWVDGARIDLEYGAAEDIKVVGGDVYLAGQWFDETGWNGSARYWKNDERFVLEGGSQSGTEVSAIFVDNGDVYVIGWRFQSHTTIACYWKNGDSANVQVSWLLDIAVKDNIKISVGYYHPGVEYEYDYTPYLPCFPMYYVNGKRYNLEDFEWQDGMATGVDIY